MIKRSQLGALLFFGISILWSASTSPAPAVTEPVPIFEVDTSWPTIPNGWTLGNVAKISIDGHDNVWIIHRPVTVPAGKIPAPPVLEFDSSGKLIRSWGGPGQGYDWPRLEHNIFVDTKNNVFISGASPNGNLTPGSDDMILKFTVDGKFLKQMGGYNTNKNNLDTTSVNKPGDIYVWPKTNELFVADGYGNRRVIVFDADTFAFKRMWGAYGKPVVDLPYAGGPGPSGGPADAKTGPEGGGNAKPLDATGPGPDQFNSPVHGVLISNDNLLYVADRTNRRVQVFTPEGKYLKEMFLNRAGPKAQTVCGLAFSPDRAQKYLYLSDYGNSHIAIVDRKTLKVLYQFGQRGTEPGNFRGIHHIAIDSKGNLYAGEVAPGSRIQRFIYKGLSPTLPANALTEQQLSPNP